MHPTNYFNHILIILFFVIFITSQVQAEDNSKFSGSINYMSEQLSYKTHGDPQKRWEVIGAQATSTSSRFEMELEWEKLRYEIHLFSTQSMFPDKAILGDTEDDFIMKAIKHILIFNGYSYINEHSVVTGKAVIVNVPDTKRGGTAIFKNEKQLTINDSFSVGAIMDKHLFGVEKTDNSHDLPFGGFVRVGAIQYSISGTEFQAIAFPQQREVLSTSSLIGFGFEAAIWHITEWYFYDFSMGGYLGEGQQVFYGGDIGYPFKMYKTIRLLPYIGYYGHWLDGYGGKSNRGEFTSMILEDSSVYGIKLNLTW